MRPLLMRNVVKYGIQRQFFKLRTNPLWPFLTSTGLSFYLECSAKIQRGKVYADRCNAWFCDTIHHARTMLQRFLRAQEREHSVCFDLTMLDRYLSRVDRASRVGLVIGCDLREDTPTSRYKMWTACTCTDDLFEELVRGYPASIRALFGKSDLLFGFDLGFDGSTAIKTYPSLSGEALNDASFRILSGHFGRRTMELVRSSLRIHITLAPKHGYVVHFEPRSFSAFTTAVEETEYAGISKTIQIRSMSLLPEEIEAHKVENMNLYW